jgi:hypothetical protein
MFLKLKWYRGYFKTHQIRFSDSPKNEMPLLPVLRFPKVLSIAQLRNPGLRGVVNLGVSE